VELYSLLLGVDDDKLEKLKFPLFHKVVLRQSHWSPEDDLGRVKLVMAEGFAREGHSCEVAFPAGLRTH